MKSLRKGSEAFSVKLRPPEEGQSAPNNSQVSHLAGLAEAGTDLDHQGMAIG